MGGGYAVGAPSMMMGAGMSSPQAAYGMAQPMPAGQGGGGQGGGGGGGRNGSNGSPPNSYVQQGYMPQGYAAQ